MTLILIIGAASDSTAQMVFDLDFNQDGSLEIFYPLQADETVAVDIYVSNIPSPGLRTIGFVLTYDDSHLEVVPESAVVDAVNWPINMVNDLVSGQIEMIGGRILPAGIAGDNIKLGQVTFRALQTGVSVLRLFDRGETVDSFVLADGDVLDDDIAGGVHLARVHAGCPADSNADGDVDGMELANLIAVFDLPDCNGSCESDYDGDDVVSEADLAILATDFGRINCLE
jgi:hypothetical protein